MLKSAPIFLKLLTDSCSSKVATGPSCFSEVAKDSLYKLGCPFNASESPLLLFKSTTSLQPTTAFIPQPYSITLSIA